MILDLFLDYISRKKINRLLGIILQHEIYECSGITVRIRVCWNSWNSQTNWDVFWGSDSKKMFY